MSERGHKKAKNSKYQGGLGRGKGVGKKNRIEFEVRKRGGRWKMTKKEKPKSDVPK